MQQNDLYLFSIVQVPKDIARLAEEIKLTSDEVDLYGKKKAKVSLKVQTLCNL